MRDELTTKKHKQVLGKKAIHGSQVVTKVFLDDTTNIVNGGFLFVIEP